MAQFKDLLVTGPTKILGDIIFNKLPKYNNVNLATITDINNLFGQSTDAIGTMTLHGINNFVSKTATGLSDVQEDIAEILKGVSTDYDNLLKIETKIKAIDQTLLELDNSYATDQQLSNAIDIINTNLTNYVTINTDQTITGKKSFTNNITISTNNTNDISTFISNGNGAISVLASNSRGLYDNTNNNWIIYRKKNTTKTLVPAWASLGNSNQPIYFNSNGEPAVCSDSVGNTNQPIYMSSGTMTGITKVSIIYGGTGATTADGACENIGAIKKSGDTMEGPLNFANDPNGIWNVVGDDSMFGDQNVAGAFCIKGNNGATTLRMYSYDNSVTTTANFQYNTSDKCIDVIFN